MWRHHSLLASSSSRQRAIGDNGAPPPPIIVVFAAVGGGVVSGGVMDQAVPYFSFSSLFLGYVPASDDLGIFCFIGDVSFRRSFRS
jgi:hypothetical protein